MNKLGLIKSIAILLASICSCSGIAAEVTKPMVVSHLQLAGYGAHYAYRYQLVKEALEITRPEFGDYQLAPYTSRSTSARYAQLIGEGKLLNLNWASPGTPIANAEVIEIPIDILNGLVGYRVCLINQAGATDLSKVHDVRTLATIKIGQGIWADRAIYKANQIDTVESPNFDNLFMMLSANRFECIALGIDEVLRIYDTRKMQYPFLAIDSHLLIHYNYPIYLYVSKNNPKLAQRITLGLKKLQNNGDYNRLFYKHHSEGLERLRLQTRNLICLKSPYQQEHEPCTRPPVIPIAYKQPSPH